MVVGAAAMTRAKRWTTRVPIANCDEDGKTFLLGAKVITG